MKSTRIGAVASTLVFASLAVLAAHSCGKPELPGEVPQANYTEPEGNIAVPYPGIPTLPGNSFRGEKNFAELINKYTQGTPQRIPWAGFWWPYTANGIASGIYGSGKSPAGKYDAAHGGRTNAQGWEIKNHGSGVPKVAGWWGHCNGWCAAAALFPEPNKEVTVNGVTFGIADIKGLLSEAGMEVSADFFGNRVDWGQDYNSPKYYDTVPDQFFLLLTNYMGKMRMPILIDRFTGDQVWNQPMVAYRFDYPKKDDYLGATPQAPNIYRIQMTATIWWGRDDVPADVQTGPFEWAENVHFQERALKLELWLDGPVEFGPDGKIKSSGNVVVTREGDYIAGGAWKNGDGYYNDSHPDYMWIPYTILKPTEFSNPHLDIEWIKKHILSGGVDDPNVSPSSIPNAPSPSPRAWPSGFPGGDWPTSNPTGFPTGNPTTGPNPRPTSPWPFPTTGPQPQPQPQPVPVTGPTTGPVNPFPGGGGGGPVGPAPVRPGPTRPGR